MTTTNKLNAVAFWIKLGQNYNTTYTLTLILPLTILTIITLQTAQTIINNYPHIITLQYTNTSPLLKLLTPIIQLIPYWITWATGYTIFSKTKRYVRIAIIKIMLWNRQNKINQAQKTEQLTEAKTKDLIELIQQKGYTLENPT